MPFGKSPRNNHQQTSREQRCLKDLRERFARIEIHASKPIVAFRETAVRAAGKFCPSLVLASDPMLKYS